MRSHWKKPKSYSPLLYDYLKKYQEDPTSRIFAPLAEAYRKAGLIDEAIEIAREGLRIHPHFIGGRVALARALFDRQEYKAVLDELLPIIADVPDNLVAQRLIAESCLMLGRPAEALSAYKMILYYHPADQETAKIIAELEAQVYEKGLLALRKDQERKDQEQRPEEFHIVSARQALGTQALPQKPLPEQQHDAVRRSEQWLKKIHLLQDLLLRVERYRARIAIRHMPW